MENSVISSNLEALLRQKIPPNLEGFTKDEFYQVVALSLNEELEGNPIILSMSLRTAVRSLKNILPASYLVNDRVHTPYGNPYISKLKTVKHIGLKKAIENFSLRSYPDYHVRLMSESNDPKNFLRSRTLVYYKNPISLEDYIRENVEFIRKVVEYRIRNI